MQVLLSDIISNKKLTWMKIKILILGLILSGIIFGQELKIKTGFGFADHISNTEPKDFYNEKDVPSIGYFFGNGIKVNTSVIYKFSPDSPDGTFLIGLHYEYHKSTSEREKYEILGDEIDVQSFGLSIGIGNYVGEKTFFYGSVGVFGKKYSGKGNDDFYELKYKNNYENGLAGRFTLGIDFNNIGDSPVGFSLDVNYEYGTVKRKNVEWSKDDGSAGIFIVTGDKVLPDHQYSINIGFFYLVNF